MNVKSNKTKKKKLSHKCELLALTTPSPPSKRNLKIHQTEGVNVTTVIHKVNYRHRCLLDLAESTFIKMFSIKPNIIN